MYAQSQLARTIDRLRGDPACAPRDILEQARMRLLESEEVIASVDGRAEHGVIAGLCEKFRSFDQQRGRQGGAVGIEHNGTLMPALEQFAHRELQAVPEVGQPRFEQSYVGVNRVLKKGGGSRRPEGQIA